MQGYHREIQAEDDPEPDTHPVAERNRAEGHVVYCDGTHAIVAAHVARDDGASSDYWTVGQLISIRVGQNRVVGMLYKVDTDPGVWHDESDNLIHIHIELVGEITEESGEASFSGGISSYPYLGAVAHRIRKVDLAAVYENTDSRAVELGHLSQNPEIPALISIDSLISRHFAVVGTTGVGKSTAVSLLLRQVVDSRPDVRILILDPHNEFSCAFPDLAITIHEKDLDLPFWLFRLEEFTEVLFRGRPPVPEEVDVLRELIPIAKVRFKGNDKQGLRRSADSTAVTSDTPIPYRISDLIALIDERIGKLDGRDERPYLRALMGRLDAAVNDPRYKFMFVSKTIEDNISDVISTIYRVPANGKPITAFQMSGMPSEVVNSVASVLCRLAFDLAIWSRSKVQTLVICEEAHRYIPANQEAGFMPTRAAIARIAKEGRKYGVYLGIVTQRPGELDETILSQCNTFFAMRLGNDRDQEIMRRAISGSSRSAINFLPSLANREAIAFGQGVATPMRMRFKRVESGRLPGNHLYDEQAAAQDGSLRVNLDDVVQKMRFPRGATDFEDVEGPVGPRQPLSEHVVGEQKPSVDGPVRQQRPPSEFPLRNTEAAGLFTEEASLRQKPPTRFDPRREDPPRRERESEEQKSARDLISRFRR